MRIRSALRTTRGMARPGGPVSAFAVLLAAALLLSGCELLAGRTGGGTETNTLGILHYTDGTLAVSATITVRPKDYVADSLLTQEQRAKKWTFSTDSKGRFSIKRLPLGAYRMEAQSGLRRGLIKDFVLDKEGQRLTLDPDTLRTNGTLFGRIVDTTGNRGGYVQIYGLERLVPADTGTGYFMIDDLPPGKYDLRCLGLGAFRKQAVIKGVELQSGQKLTLEDIVLEEVPKLAYDTTGGAVAIEGVDSTLAVVFDNEFWDNGVENEYIWSKFAAGKLDLKGNIVTDALRKNLVTIDQQMMKARHEQRTALLAGIRDIPDPVEGSRHALVPAASGRIEDMDAEITPGVTRILAEARQASLERPLIVIVGGPLTTVANAYLADPDIAPRMVVLSIYPFSINSADSLAAYVVAKRCRLVVWGGDYVWTGPLDTTLLAKLPTSRMGERVRAQVISSARNGNASFGDIAPATWLFRPSVWKKAFLARVDYPLQVQPASSLSFDFLGIPKEANDWTGYQEEFFSAMGNAAAFQPLSLPGRIEAEAYRVRSDLKAALTLPGSAPDTSYGDALSGTPGSWLEWAVDNASAGPRALAIRYKAPAGGVLKLTSGGNTLATVSLPAQPDWAETTTEITAASGALPLRAEWAEGAFQLDWIESK